MRLVGCMVRTAAWALALGPLLLFGRPQTNTPTPAPPPLPTSLPPLPPTRSPIDLFRELLAMTPAERKVALTNRPPEIQKQISGKIREYESMRPNERELKLQATELRFYLLPVLNLPATNRAPYLVQIPTQTRKLVLARLRQWDQLPAAAREELLDNEAAIRYFTESAAATEEQKRQLLGELSPERREKLELSLARWRTLREDERSRVEQRWNNFLDLSAEEKARSLSALSEAERRQIEKSLQAFSSLPPAQRMECLRAYRKFTGLSPEERHQFLKSAERWRALSPEERDAWRRLVARLSVQPPTPPGVKTQAPPPPLPVSNPHAVATNGH